jgi:hypothetical protein
VDTTIAMSPATWAALEPTGHVGINLGDGGITLTPAQALELMVWLEGVEPALRDHARRASVAAGFRVAAALAADGWVPASVEVHPWRVQAPYVFARYPAGGDVGGIAEAYDTSPRPVAGAGPGCVGVTVEGVLRVEAATTTDGGGPRPGVAS